MNLFTSTEADGDLLRPVSKDKTPKTKTFTRKLRLDSKGRILLPVELRRNFGIDQDYGIKVVFSLEKDFALLLFEKGGGEDG